ncbi:uncharacterized protein LAESUDRAFT_775008, partial [Laetiporus sulphureus 93-53]
APPTRPQLPQFDFEKSRKERQRQRSASLSNAKVDVNAAHGEKRTGDVTATFDRLQAYAQRESGAVSVHKSDAHHDGGAEAVHTAVATGARPESPLRKAKSVPFIRRPVRRDNPPALPHPPLLPTSTSLPTKLAPPTFFQSPREAPQPPRTPPNVDEGMVSFMHITPEQDGEAGVGAGVGGGSRMSRLWSRARAGMGMGVGEGGKRRESGMIKREKSSRWLRGSAVQAMA